jgi:transcriptional regulator with XRE-family HTH domain
MIQQPELGKKIIDLRKARGLTQEELVEKCNLSVRTLQRIEAGEVTPRPITIKLIFEALDVSFEITEGEKGFKIKWHEQFYRYFIELIDLKKIQMKKIAILLFVFIIMIVCLFNFNYKTLAQRKAVKVEQEIESLAVNLNKWLNYGMIDSLLTLYSDDACVIPFSCGKKEIADGLLPLINGGYKIIDYKTLSISVSGSIAVEKYFSLYQFMGKEYRQKGIKEWHLTGKKWLIVNQMMMDY